MENKPWMIKKDGLMILLPLGLGLGLELIRCLPDILDRVQDAFGDIMAKDYALNIRYGAFSLHFGREACAK